MSFKSVFISVVIATALIFGALLFNTKRPKVASMQPNVEYVKAQGKCAECHRNETSGIVHQFERSRHVKAGVTCLDCHNPNDKQEAIEHRGFKINKEVSSGNCKACHKSEYDQFNRSRHGAPAWSAVKGKTPFTKEQIEHAEKYHPGATDRGANKLIIREGMEPGKGELISKENYGSIVGCEGCHDIGKPNEDGSVGKCTECHGRHNTSVELARQPETCGQCHMGPDHSQLEIFNESKHGAIWAMDKHKMNLTAKPKELTTADMPSPSCATCHMSGIEGLKVTHDVTERLSYWLFAPISKKRPNYTLSQANMKDVCTKCHSKPEIDTFYKNAEGVVRETNVKVAAAKKIIDDLKKEGLLTPTPFDEPIEFLYFDLWHYFGRTAKHGAFMGGPDFVQWHGNYELLYKMKEMEEIAHEIRAKAKKGKH